jgi:hypothetical protein
MRTIMAVDEMLASLVARRVPGKVQFYDRSAMRKKGDDIVRDAALVSPCVLLIGGMKWNPLRLVASWNLPRTVVVVAVVPRIKPVVVRRAVMAGVFSVTASMHGVADCLADECVLAAATLVGLRPWGRRPRVLIADGPPRPARKIAASVHPLKRESPPRQVA